MSQAPKHPTRCSLRVERLNKLLISYRRGESHSLYLSAYEQQVDSSNSICQAFEVVNNIGLSRPEARLS